MIPCIVLPISQLHNTAQRTACTQNVPIDVTFHLSTSSPLCKIREPRYRQNNKRYHILRIGYLSIFDYLDNLIPNIVLPISQLPISPRKLFVLITYLWMSPFISNMSQLCRLIVVGEIKPKLHKTLMLRFFWDTLHFILFYFILFYFILFFSLIPSI